MPPNEPNHEEDLEKLPEDHQTPFAPPVDISDDGAGAPQSTQDDVTSYPTDPATDTNVQLEEMYDEGAAGASELTTPSENAVTGYNPPDKK